MILIEETFIQFGYKPQDLVNGSHKLLHQINRHPELDWSNKIKDINNLPRHEKECVIIDKVVQS